MSDGKLLQPIVCKSCATPSAQKQMPKHAELKTVPMSKKFKAQLFARITSAHGFLRLLISSCNTMLTQGVTSSMTMSDPM